MLLFHEQHLSLLRYITTFYRQLGITVEFIVGIKNTNNIFSYLIRRCIFDIYILTTFKACAERGLAHVVLFKLESPAWKETTFFKTRLELFFFIYNKFDL